MLMVHWLTRLQSAAEASPAAEPASLSIPGRMFPRAAFRDERFCVPPAAFYIPSLSRRFYHNRHHRRA